MNEENIKQQIDLAAAIGAELFIVDAGWWDTYGDWTASTKRFPHGLASIADYVHQKGMLLAFMPRSKARAEIGLIAVGAKNIRTGSCRISRNRRPHQAGSGGARRGATSRMIEDFKLDLYRHDYNTPFTGELGQREHDGIQENMYWRYYEAWYRIIEHIHAKYPNLILQQAAAGGMRNDLGMAGRWHEPYLTDGLNMPHVLRNYSGQTLGQPPENFVIAFGIPAVSPNRGHFDTHLRATFTLATPWLAPVGPSLQDLSPERLEQYRHYVNLYKTFIRPLWPTCKMYHHAPVTAHQGVDADPWFAMEFASPDRAKGWATIVRLAETDSDTYLFRPRGLDPAKSYRVTFDSTGTTARIDGARLIQEGLHPTGNGMIFRIVIVRGSVTARPRT